MSRAMVLELKLWHVLNLITSGHSKDAAPLIDTLVFDESYSDMPASCELAVACSHDYLHLQRGLMLALGAAENAL